MQLRIENIGPIGSAVIDLTGLTVIGGLNDTGKSTIGKSIFAVVKAIRNKEQEYTSVQRSRVNAILSELTSELRNALGPKISPASLISATRSFTGNSTFDQETPEILEKSLGHLKAVILREIGRRIFRQNISRQIDTTDEVLADEDTSLTIIDHHIQRIRVLLTAKKDNKSIYANAFSNIMNSMFRGEINNKRAKSSPSYIEIWDNNAKIFGTHFQDNISKDFYIEEITISELFDDVTLLESPMVLTYEDAGTYYPDASSGHYYGDYPAYDLMQKLQFATKELEADNGLEREINEKISEIIKGKIYFDLDEGEFIFSSIDEIQVKITNTASGVKTLGIMQMLARAGVLTGTNLLIVDEPEVHLHPEWQIVYAEIIAILVKKYNIYCLISSHSPYFIQSIEAYSKLYNMQDLTKFYITNKDKNTSNSNIEDITSDPEPLYKLLADPMKRIAFLRAKAQDE